MNEGRKEGIERRNYEKNITEIQQHNTHTNYIINTNKEQNK